MRNLINWSIRYQQPGGGQPSGKDMRDVAKGEPMDVKLPGKIPAWAGPVEEQDTYREFCG